MKKVYVINGPNINLLGIREKEIYGQTTYKELVSLIKSWSQDLSLDAEVFQSNHEGDLIDFIQSKYGEECYFIINAGGLSHTSISLLDALKAVNIKTIEVHLSSISSREDYRHHSYIKEFASFFIEGRGIDGYYQALKLISEGKI